MKNYLALLGLLALFAVGCGKGTDPVPAPQPVEGYATGYIKPPKGDFGVGFWRPKRGLKGAEEVPRKYDLADKGLLPPIRNQGGCGSCWAFAGVRCFEIAARRATGQFVDLSEQHVVSGDKSMYGCGGGWMPGDFMQKVGVATEADYPYTSGRTGQTGSLKAGVKPWGKIERWVRIGSPGKRATLEQHAEVLASDKAIWVTAAATSGWGSKFTGVYPKSKCTNGTQNHAITATAYDLDLGTLTVDNSWGVNVGNQGRQQFPFGCDRLGHEESAYVIFKDEPGKPPSAKLPAEYIVTEGDEVVLAVKAETGVTYTWYEGSIQLGTGPLLVVTVNSSRVVRLIAKNQHGELEVQTQVTVKKD